MDFYISRFKEIDCQEFILEVVTPMFLSGSDVDIAEVRSPSFKGILRFWWRATFGDISNDGMKAKEEEIFGSTTGKSSVSILISTKGGDLAISKELKQRGRTFPVHGKQLYILDYLAYGTHKYVKGSGNVYHKENIAPGNLLTLNLKYNKKYENETINALKWLIHYGGVGSRNRNGFGSITCTIARPDINTKSALKDFNANSIEARLFIFQERSTWFDAHSDIGLAYREARLFVERLHSYNRRKLISAPLTVNKRNEADLERHAKPYFLHVNKLPNGKFQGQILFMPYNYYDVSKRREYFETCKKMNEKLYQLSGGSK